MIDCLATKDLSYSVLCYVLCVERLACNGVPSHVTFREILINLDKEELKKSFACWSAMQDLSLLDWVSRNGKALRSTVANIHFGKWFWDFSTNMFFAPSAEADGKENYKSL